MFRRVLVTLDGSSLSEAILPEAAKLLRGTEAEVHLLIVAEEPRATAVRPESESLLVGFPAPGGVVRMKAALTVETKAQASGRATDELRDFLIAEAVPFERVGIRYHTAVRFGDPAEEIVGYAEKENVDLIMMATHGHTGLARLVFGSVAARAVASGVCPVMLVRPDGLKQGKGTPRHCARKRLQPDSLAIRLRMAMSTATRSAGMLRRGTPPCGAGSSCGIMQAIHWPLPRRCYCPAALFGPLLPLTTGRIALFA